MTNFYKGGRGLAYSQREGGACFRKEKPPRLSKILTNQVREGGAALPSATVREVVDISSKHPRYLFDTGSGAVREVFECCSGGSRRTVEAHPKDYRRCPEPVPKRTRSASEGHPNSTRRYKSFFDHFLSKFKARIKYRCRKDVVPFTQRLRKVAEVPLMYRECTVSVRGLYRKGTVDLLRSYWRSTTDLLNACTSGVDQRYSKSRRVVGVEAMKNKGVLLYGLLCFMLFNLSDAWAQSVEPRTAEGQTEIKPLQIGDTIPEEVWNLPLQVVNHPDGKDTITLNDYRDKKLIILDFWATWCKSCIEGFPNLSRLKQTFPEQLDVLLVNTLQTKDTPSRVQQLLSRNKKVHDYDLDLPYIMEDTLFQQLFRHKIIPHVVWLDGDLRFIGSSHGYEVTTKNITNFLENGRIEFFQKDDYHTEQRAVLSSDDIKVSRFYRYQDVPRYKRLKIDSVGDYVNYSIVNQPLSYMIELAWGVRNVPTSLWTFPENKDGDRIRTAIRRLSSNPPLDLFCYDFKTNMATSFETFEKNLRNDLQDFLGYNIAVEKDSVAVRILKPTQRLTRLQTKGGILQSRTSTENLPMYMQNVHITGLQNYLSNLFRKPTLVDKHDIDVSIDIELPDNLYELSDADLEQLVQSIGFQVYHETRLLTTFQFTEIL